MVTIYYYLLTSDLIFISKKTKRGKTRPIQKSNKLLYIWATIGPICFIPTQLKCALNLHLFALKKCQSGINMVFFIYALVLILLNKFVQNSTIKMCCCFIHQIYCKLVLNSTKTLKNLHYCGYWCKLGENCTRLDQL